MIINLEFNFYNENKEFRLVQKKNRPEKFPFTATNNWIIGCPKVCKIFFLLQISRYFGKVVEKTRSREAITKHWAFQATIIINIDFVLIWLVKLNKKDQSVLIIVTISLHDILSLWIYYLYSPFLYLLSHINPISQWIFFNKSSIVGRDRKATDFTPSVRNSRMGSYHKHSFAQI